MKVKLLQRSIFVIPILITIVLFGCIGGGPYVGQMKMRDGIPVIYDKNKTWVPAWVMGKLPYSEQGGYRDVLQAVGMSAPMRNPELSRRRAISSGRAELARVLGLKVQNLIKEWTQEHTDYFDNSGDSSIVYYEEVGRQITNAELIGSQVEAIYEHPVTNITYALIGISRSEAIEQVMSHMKEIARRRKTAFVEGKVDDAMKELDDVLKKTKPEDFYESGTIK